MTMQRSDSAATSGRVELGFGSVAERRAQIEYEQEVLMAERQRQLNAQRSSLNSPQERIRMWEQLHGLKLPRLQSHKLIPVIAMQTELTVDEVHDEQARRVAPPI